MNRTRPFNIAEMELAASLEKARRTRTEADPDPPFRILVLGDFSGRSSRGVHDPGSLGFDRLPLRVDREDIDELMANLEVELRLFLGSTEGPAISIRPRQVDDFHPDRLFEDAHAFSGLRQLLEKVDDPGTFEEAAAEVRSWGTSSSSASVAPAPVIPPTAQDASHELVAEMLESAAQRRQDAGEAGFNSFLRQVVAPHLMSREDPLKEELKTTVEFAVASWMRDILHHRHFQAVESAWRGLRFLVDRLETNEDLEICVLDVTKSELADDIRSAKELTGSAISKMLVENTVGTSGGRPWAVLVGLYTFEPTLEDVAMLGRLAQIASAAGAPFLAASSPSILGCQSLVRTPDPNDWDPPSQAAELWDALRGVSEASYLGLALPRFLLRLPYGKDTDPIERFDFEEIDEGQEHEDYLWGSPAIACACLLGELFTEFGWHLQPSTGRDLEALPLHVVDANGKPRIQPCAEVLLTDRAAEAILDRGLMPLVSIKDRDLARLVRFQSIANPPKRLSGRWS